LRVLPLPFPFEARAFAYVQFVVSEIQKALLQTALVPPSIPLRPEEDCALIVVQTVNLEAMSGKVTAYLGTDESIGAGN